MEKEEKYKIIFVKEDGIEYYGEPGEGTMHSIYLENYIKKYFNTHPVLGRLTMNYGADSLAYALTYFEKIAIIMNETKIGADGKPKYGTFACIELPSEISEKLEAQLLGLAPSLEQFSQVVIEKSLVENNYLIGEVLDIESDLPIEEKIKKAIKLVNGKDEYSKTK